MMTITNKQKESLIKAGIAGGLLSGAVTIMYGNAPIDLAGYEVPSMIPLFLGGAGASLATDFISSQLSLPTDSSQKIADLSALAVSSGISGAAAVGLLKVAVGLPNENVLPVFAIAAASQAGSDYIVHRWLEDQTGMLMF